MEMEECNPDEMPQWLLWTNFYVSSSFPEMKETDVDD